MHTLIDSKIAAGLKANGDASEFQEGRYFFATIENIVLM